MFTIKHFNILIIIKALVFNVSGQNVVVVGGWTSTGNNLEFVSPDTSQNCVTPLIPLPTDLNFPEIVVANNQIFAIGNNYYEYGTLIYAIRPASGQTSIPTTIDPNTYFTKTMTKCSHDGKPAVAIGGIIYLYGDYCFESFDITTGQTTRLENPPVYSGNNPCMVTDRTDLYVIGPNSGVMKYTVATNKWEILNPTKFPGHYFINGCVFLGGDEILALQNKQPFSTASTAGVFDIVKKQWTKTVTTNGKDMYAAAIEKCSVNGNNGPTVFDTLALGGNSLGPSTNVKGFDYSQPATPAWVDLAINGKLQEKRYYPSTDCINVGNVNAPNVAFDLTAIFPGGNFNCPGVA